jgi:hypothetical protein
MKFLHVAADYDRRHSVSAQRPATVIGLRYLWWAGALALTACGLGGFPESNMAKVKPGMTHEQVEALLGRPTTIEQSETPDQTLTGQVYHYAAPKGEGRVLFINETVFRSEFVTEAKS